MPLITTYRPHCHSIHNSNRYKLMIQGLSQGFASDHQAVDIVPDAKMQFIHQGNVT